MTLKITTAIKPLRVAVTGGSGRIGREVIKVLLKRGHAPVNLDRRQSPEPLCRFVFTDLRRREQLQPIFEQVDAVCHLGEIPHSNAPYAPDEIFSHNVAAGSAVLETAADLKIARVIYTSTAQTYGCWGPEMVPPLYFPLDEKHKLQPQNVYSLSKVANEKYAELTTKRHGMSIAIFRFPWVMDNDYWRDESDIWRMLMYSTGAPEGFASYVHTRDAAMAYALALENPRPGCEAYHFTADDVFSAMPIRQRLLKFNPDYPALPHDWPDYKCPVSTAKALEHFGWKPEINLISIFRKKHGCDPHVKYRSQPAP